jgi:hypothetical protein
MITFKLRTNARKGEVVQRIQGGASGSINPTKVEYWKVVDECGQNGFYGPKDAVQTNYEEFKESGTNK